MNCDREISYYERKQQNPSSKPCILNKKGIPALVKTYKSLDIIKDSGLEYISSNPIFNVIETSLYTEKEFSQYGNTETRYSFLYVISKNIGEQLYFKFGSGGNSKQANNLRLSRIEGAQTFLIPGIGDNVGFKVHFMIFYKNTTYLDKVSMHEFIEKSVHRILQSQFKAANIKFGTENPSEWYLVQKPNGQSDDPAYFCGFLIDVLSTYAHRDSKLSPCAVWKLSDKENNKKKNASRKITLPSKEESQKRLVAKNSIYDKILEVLRSRGLRNEREIIIEEGDENTLMRQKGNLKAYKNEIIEHGEIVTENNKTIGSIFQYPPTDGKKYLITDIVLNRLKYSFGQPLEYNEFYAKIKPYNHDRIEMALFETKDIAIIPKFDSKNGDTYIFSDYYMKIEDLLELIKPSPDAMKTWPLKENYEYYQMRAKGKSYKVYEMPKNVELPDWYFTPKVQDTWAKIFSGATVNSKFTKYQGTHNDTKHDDSSDSSVYEWKVVARIYKTDDNKKTRQNILLKRETTINEKIVEEEIPITRLMMLYDIPKTIKEEIRTREVIRYNGIDIKKDFTCLLPAGFFNSDYEENESEIYTYRVHKVFVKELYQDGENIENIDYMEIGQIYPWSNNKTWNTPISNLPVLKNKDILTAPKYKAGTIIKFKPNDIKKLRGVYGGDTEPYTNNDGGDYYTIQSIKSLGPVNKYGAVTPESQHYAKITKVMTTNQYIYEISYFPPYDTKSPWPVSEDKYIDAPIKKKFGKHTYNGVVLMKDKDTITKNAMWKVIYDDKDEEDLFEDELKSLLVNKKKVLENKRKGVHNNPKKVVKQYVHSRDIDKHMNEKFYSVGDNDRGLEAYLKKLETQGKTRKGGLSRGGGKNKTRKKMK